jgi:hypothetical protein
MPRSALLGPLYWTTSLRPRLEEVEHKMRNIRNPYTDSASPLSMVSLNLRLYMVILQDFRNGFRCAVKEVHSNGDDIAGGWIGPWSSRQGIDLVPALWGFRENLDHGRTTDAIRARDNN